MLWLALLVSFSNCLSLSSVLTFILSLSFFPPNGRSFLSIFFSSYGSLCVFLFVSSPLFPGLKVAQSGILSYLCGVTGAVVAAS